jgi:CRISPR-associated endoribonuclease Cas6
VPVRFSTHRLRGFVGECTYTANANDERARRVLHLLADFAFFAGVGMKRTMGMGQVIAT